MGGVNQAGSQASTNQVPYNIVPVFSPVFIPFVNLFTSKSCFNYQFHTPPYQRKPFSTCLHGFL